jgi:SAM-dependent methyltransferase
MDAAVVERFNEELTTRLAQPGERTPSELFGDASDDLWLWINTEGYRRHPELRDILLGLPEDEIQRRFTFRTGDDTLVEGFAIYLLVRDLYERHIGRLEDAQAVLDFGCGYARVLRFFLRDIDHHRLTGTDYDGDLVDFCRRSSRWCNFVQNGAEPPLPFDDDQFQYVFAYSVFSHFSETMHLRWLEELQRIVRPGGALALSVRRRNFIKSLRDLRESATSDNSRIALKMFVDTDRELARYDAGEFCFSPYRADMDPWWGEACIPRAYVEREWSRLFEVVEFVEGTPLNADEVRQAPRPTCEQNFVLLRA